MSPFSQTYSFIPHSFILSSSSSCLTKQHRRDGEWEITVRSITAPLCCSFLLTLFPAPTLALHGPQLLQSMSTCSTIILSLATAWLSAPVWYSAGVPCSTMPSSRCCSTTPAPALGQSRSCSSLFLSFFFDLGVHEAVSHTFPSFLTVVWCFVLSYPGCPQDGC